MLRSVCFALLLLVVIVLVEFMPFLPDVGDPRGGKLSDIDKASVEILRDSIKISIGWGVAIIGGMGLMMRFAADGRQGLSKRALFLGELAMVSAVVSIFFGHMSIIALLNMLANDIYSIRDTALLGYERLQYVFLLCSLLVLIVYVHCVFWRCASK